MILAWIDPVALSFGPVSIHWYGIMYAIAFMIGYAYLAVIIKKEYISLSLEQLDSVILIVFTGLVFGGRFGYILFYNLGYYLAHPLHMLYVWDGGLSFHGGLLVIIAIGYWYVKKCNISFFEIADHVVVIASLGMVFGRIGNFINGELYGKPTDLPWGIQFPGLESPHHPSQLYEATQNLVFFLIMLPLILSPWYRKMKPGMIFWSFFLYYGLVRFFIEFIRLPDPQLGYLAFGWLTMGQILCMVMIAIGTGGLAHYFLKKL